MFAMKDKWP